MLMLKEKGVSERILMRDGQNNFQSTAIVHVEFLNKNG